MIYLLSSNGESKIALRYSEFEGLDTLQNMKGKVDWVWVDCFTRLPLDASKTAAIRAMGYRICIVSPELQGREDSIALYASQLKNENIIPDAICTKWYHRELWTKLLGL